MDFDPDHIQRLVEQPAEALNVEIKRWIDPKIPEDQAKIVKSALALRNRDGGFLLIGIDDKTLLPDERGVPSDPARDFHSDIIQLLVSRYASDPFEVSVAFGRREGKLYPVIVIPPGVRIPVAAKADLKGSDGANLIKHGAVYFRSLRSNGAVSTTEARPEDWSDIAEICFNNREADFGAFFRRQLAGITPDSIMNVISALRGGEATHLLAKPCDRARELLSDGARRFEEAMRLRVEAGDIDGNYLNFGSRSAALMIIGETPPRRADHSFLNLLSSSNPRYTGWPAWLDSRSDPNQKNRPYHHDGAWEALILSIGSGFFDQIDFMRMDPDGKFYLQRILEDDLTKPSYPGLPAYPQ